MQAGALKHRISLERDTITSANGAESRTPVVYAARVPCRFTFLSGNELWKAQQVQSQCNVRVELRYRSDVLASDRVIYRGKRYEIKSVIPDESTRESLVLGCKG